MSKNTGIEYEILTKEVYEEIIKKEGFKNIEVLHNVKKEGFSKTTHQIDVYFEYALAGTLHSVAIECKDYKSKVSQEKLMAFYSKIIDLRVSKGIFVSKTGFQKGAIIFAQSHGIELVELRKPEEYDWEGLVKTIHVKLKMHGVINVEIKDIEVDENWRKENNIKDINFKYSGLNSEFYFYNKEKERIFSLLDLSNKLPTNDLNSIENVHTFNFEEDVYLKNLSQDIKISSITFKYEIIENETTIKIDGETSVKAMKKNVNTGEREFIKI
ncbi:restriction endonuclease [Fusobacterium varium]|uniref:restriction endonuclease n=1 Tax=Fusobacterium varium TaxID=856 RepID=UPI00242DF6B6|nr:restriction endonuclease [Fusobacterium varium]